MSIATDLVRAEPHAEIGVVIECSTDDLVERWCTRALEEQRSAKRVHADALRDHLPRFLRSMARALLQAGDGESAQPLRAALKHGEERWESGWSLTELVRDYQILQLVILEFLEETLGRSLRCREMMAIGVFVDDAIAASIKAYVESRDGETLAREHEQKARLEEGNRRRDEFMAMLGHELRNPLAPIQDSVKIIRTVLTAPHPAVAKAVEMIERQSAHLVRLTEDILDLARIRQGRFELRRSRVSLNTVLEQSVQMSAPLFHSRGHELVVGFAETPLYVNADPQRMVQIVCNLLNNAAKYTPVGGRIELSAASEGETAVLKVRDNGMGIPPEMQSAIFELFEQLDTAREHADGGMGIGLTLVRRLVEQHGGTVACRSDGAGTGSEFIVCLPLAGESQTVQGKADAASAEATGRLLRIEPRPKS